MTDEYKNVRHTERSEVSEVTVEKRIRIQNTYYQILRPDKKSRDSE